MSNDYSTWTDWADDNPEKAARWEEHRRIAQRSNIPDRDGYESAAMYAAMYAAERTSCEHEDVDWQSLICNNCGDEMEAEEPTDAQIFAQYGQTMEPRAA